VPRKPNPGETLWSEALVARLSELWLSGTTSGEIGRRLGISRSSVMGKLRRLDLLCRDRPRMPIRSRWEAARNLLRTEQNIEQAIPVPKPVPEKVPNKRHKRQAKSPDRFFAEFAAKPPPPPPEPAYGTLTVLDLRHNSCRWPSDGDGPWTFCGRPILSETSYCPDHHRRAHNASSSTASSAAAAFARAWAHKPSG
jgi:GcrA cell cycle regulator